MDRTGASARSGPLLAPFANTLPRIGDPIDAARDAAVLGRAILGARARLGARSVIRADGEPIEIGEDFSLGHGATVHIAPGLPTKIADRVTVGRNAVVHASTLSHDCIVGDDAVVLDGSHLGAGAVLAPGTIVYPRSKLEGGWRYGGNPAVPRERMDDAQRAALRREMGEASPELFGGGASDAGIALHRDHFLAPTARLAGTVQTDAGVGIWYGCRLDGTAHGITIGANTNVQDNAVIRAVDGPVVIGADVTIGHNVWLTDCTVEPNCLIGIGAHLAPLTAVERDVLVAAGARTQTGQRLRSGHVWGGNPARPIASMDATKRALLAATLATYRAYAKHFREARHTTLREQGT